MTRYSPEAHRAVREREASAHREEIAAAIWEADGPGAYPDWANFSTYRPGEAQEYRARADAVLPFTVKPPALLAASREARGRFLELKEAVELTIERHLLLIGEIPSDSYRDMIEAAAWDLISPDGPLAERGLIVTPSRDEAVTRDGAALISDREVMAAQGAFIRATRTGPCPFGAMRAAIEAARDERARPPKGPALWPVKTS